ncbi:glycosyltransferase family 2 protein [Allorhizobium undicola]|uniref:glycosyltransferase family 2 protein n=1 Tax=Allorhizobium undicola TaxID=78527 RepID=UPI00047F2D06|nr:glycosyltransferase family 2 protein [Allorhizobium undicola]
MHIQSIRSFRWLLASLRTFTDTNFHLVVCEDGGADETVRICDGLGIPVVTGKNRGISWNKNRGLYWLVNHTDATHILIIEDDMIAFEKGWQKSWMAAIDKWGHVNWANDHHLKPYLESRNVTGKGSIEDPYFANVLTGCLMGFSREAIEKVGYYDPRLAGYGFEHLDLSFRLKREGYGIVSTPDGKGGNLVRYVSLEAGMNMKVLPSPSDKSRVSANKELYEKIRNEATFRLPWLNEVDEAILKTEIDVALSRRKRQAPWL